MKTRFEAYQQGVQTWLTINEIRAAEGKNPVADGDELLIPVNMETRSQAQARSDSNLAAANASADDAADTRRKSDAAGGGGAEPLQDEDPKAHAKRMEFVAQQTALRNAGLLATASASRIVRREAKHLRKLVAKSVADGSPIEGEVWDFYSDLAPVVAESMAMSSIEAGTYCRAHAAVVSTSKANLRDLAIDRIEEQGTEELTALALSTKCITA
jgi:hypothetical protein